MVLDCFNICICSVCSALVVCGKCVIITCEVCECLCMEVSVCVCVSGIFEQSDFSIKVWKIYQPHSQDRPTGLKASWAYTVYCKIGIIHYTPTCMIAR